MNNSKLLDHFIDIFGRVAVVERSALQPWVAKTRFVDVFGLLLVWSPFGLVSFFCIG